MPERSTDRMNPPANWEDWPSTRKGAINVIAIFFSYLILINILTFWGQRKFFKEQNVITIIWYRWKLIPWKFVALWTTIKKEEEEVGVATINNNDVEVWVVERNIFCCGCFCQAKSYNNLKMTDTRIREGLTCSSIGLSVVAGFIMGMMIHFIPCIWWTCDWGDSDNEGMRGAIWFISGIAFGLWCIIIDALEYKHILVSSENKNISVTIKGHYDTNDLLKLPPRVVD